jgi:hypothetical protein
MVMKKKLALKKQDVAARTIQQVWRIFKARKWQKKVHEIRNIVATKFQRKWRKYLYDYLLPKKQLIAEKRGISLIKKCSKGYLVRKKLKKEVDGIKMESNY